MSCIKAKAISSAEHNAKSFSGLKTYIMPVFVTLALATVGYACPTCKQGIAEGSQQAGMVQGYFWSILFMMSMPFVIFGSLGAYFYYQVRLARAGRLPHAASATSDEREPVASS